MGRGSHTRGGSVQNGGKELGSSWSDSKPGRHTVSRNRKGGGDTEEHLAIHNQVVFAQSLVYDFRLRVGLQEEPETGGQILPESQRAAGVLDPVAGPEDSPIVCPVRNVRHHV